MTRQHLTETDVSELRVDSLDSVEPTQLVEQLQKMKRIADIYVHTENGFFAGVTIGFGCNDSDMVAEVMYEHNLRYYQSYVNHERGNHRVTFKTDTEIAGMLETAKETQANHGHVIGEVF